MGRKGRVTEAVEDHLASASGPCALYACGPKPMLHAVARLASQRGLPAEVSLDPWMGCGTGICLGCVVRIQEGGETKPRYRCACTDGPVFDAATVVWQGRRALRRRSGRAGGSVNLAVEVAGVRLKNPLIAASGTFGYGVECENLIDLSTLGGLVSKGLYLEPRDGCPTPRIVETPSGLLNAIGLQGIGIRRFVEEVLPRLAPYDTAVMVNVCGSSVEEYAEVARIAGDAPGVAALEINISCPNVREGGMAFGADPRMTHEVVTAVRRTTSRPVIAKLSPNVTDISVLARACEDAGADAVSCINTLLGLAIDVETRKPRLAFGTGGLSGPAIRPVAVRMTWQVARAVSIPVLGIGGISCGRDALEFLIAGARAVQIGTANFVDTHVYDRILTELGEYLERHGLEDINAVVGDYRVSGLRVTGGDAAMSAKDRLIVALDVPEAEQALELVERLAGKIGVFKIGSELFTAAGPELVRQLVSRGERVFLDLKFHDIPNTVARSVARGGPAWGVAARRARPRRQGHARGRRRSVAARRGHPLAGDHHPHES